MDIRCRSPGSTGERNVTVSVTPPPVRVKMDRVGVTVRSVWVIAGNAGWFSITGIPMNTYAVPSMRARPVMAVTWPVQKVAQEPGRVSAASHELKYGERTASGVAGGRIGWKAETACWWPRWGTEVGRPRAAAVP